MKISLESTVFYLVRTSTFVENFYVIGKKYFGRKYQREKAISLLILLHHLSWYYWSHEEFINTLYSFQNPNVYTVMLWCYFFQEYFLLLLICSSTHMMKQRKKEHKKNSVFYLLFSSHTVSQSLCVWKNEFLSRVVFTFVNDFVNELWHSKTEILENFLHKSMIQDKKLHGRFFIPLQCFMYFFRFVIITKTKVKIPFDQSNRKLLIALDQSNRRHVTIIFWFA